MVTIMKVHLKMICHKEGEEPDSHLMISMKASFGKAASMEKAYILHLKMIFIQDNLKRIRNQEDRKSVV